MIRTLDSLGAAEAGHLASLASIYYAWPVQPARQTATQGLAHLARNQSKAAGER